MTDRALLELIVENVKIIAEDAKEDRKLLRQVAGQVGVLTNQVGTLTEDVGILKHDVGILKQDVSLLKHDVGILQQDVSLLKHDVDTLKHDVVALKKTTTKIELCLENEIKPNITALFDISIQHGDKLDRIEKEVARHEGMVLRQA